MAMATWSCNGASSRCYSTASSRCYNTASSQRYNDAARVTAALRRYCNTCHGSVTALLQHASWQRYCSSHRYGGLRHGNAIAARIATAACVAATLLQLALLRRLASRQRCYSSRRSDTIYSRCCSNVAALL
ncbi:unnamed protein product [Sphagnum jensenii]|uniref:Uncharacterized protein n=1 Tax=Sphagnum jensenii TaxID=128206 RepID=A0ABP1BMT9_9BRYO